MPETLKSFCYGLILTCATALLSSAIGMSYLGKSYYIAVLLPSFMAFYVLLAWLLHLRKAGFLRPAGDGEDLSRERRHIQPKDPPIHRATPEEAIRILLWSACQLAILANLLYKWFGIGASY